MTIDFMLTPSPAPAAVHAAPFRPISTGEFIVKIAESETEIEAAQRLRYQVFRFDHDASPPRTTLDEDLFDAHCRHLVVLHRRSGRVVGTYRMQDDFAARHGAGFYSEVEFDLTLIKRNAGRILEVGRSCTAPDFRDGRVIHLLFAGIAAEARRIGARHIIGCASIPLCSGTLAGQFAALLAGNYGAGLAWHAPVRRPYVGGMAVELAPKADPRMLEELPPLVKAYLRFGAGVCGGPAFDYDFKTVDFLLLLPVDRLVQRYRRHFFREECPGAMSAEIAGSQTVVQRLVGVDKARGL